MMGMILGKNTGGSEGIRRRGKRDINIEIEIHVLNIVTESNSR